MINFCSISDKMGSRKRIGLDARFMLRPLRGIPRYVYSLCEMLPEDQSIDWYFFINTGFEHNDTPYTYQKRIESIQKRYNNVVFVDCKSEGEVFWEQVCLPRLIKQYRIEMIHMPGNRVCFFPGVPMVVTVHDTMEYDFVLKQRYPLSWKQNRSLKLWLYRFRYRCYGVVIYKYGIRKARQVITVSKYSAEDIQRKGLARGNQINVIHHGVDAEFTKFEPLKVEPRKFTLMLGGDSWQKNPELAIKSWALVDPVVRNKFPLKIIGFCGTKNSPVIKTISSLSLDDEIEIKGWVSEKEMIDYFRYARLFLFPSRYEGFGFPVIQAMRVGTPVVTTNKSSIPEVVGKAGIQVSPDNPQKMASSIQTLLADDIVWSLYHKMGLQQAELFGWEKSIKSHLQVYQSVIHR